MNPKSIFLDNVKSKDDVVASLIDKISSICNGENMLMVSIYDILHSRFIYCSDSFQNNMGFSVPITMAL